MSLQHQVYPGHPDSIPRSGKCVACMGIKQEGGQESGLLGCFSTMGAERNGELWEWAGLGAQYLHALLAVL